MSRPDRDSELTKSANEVKRLVKNWRTLLDMMPEMVILVRHDMVIEHLNLYAINKLGDLRGKVCTDVLCSSSNLCQSNCPVKNSLSGQLAPPFDDKPAETQINGMHVEYNYQPFQGYTSDKMVMILMRDITERKKQDQEIEDFHGNIENILRTKIDELKESETIRRRLAREVNYLKRKSAKSGPGDDLVGSSKGMQNLKEMVHQVADSDATILITGESGTGKELVANMIRRLSQRKEKGYLKVNCSSINENLLESDLFGYEKGAFTGAASRKKGKFEIVDNGTIFLDEIGDISPRMQSALLRVLQNGEIIRVGGNSPIKVDVRIIAATNADLVKQVHDGNFRLDLYYRLNIINIVIPPLRERKEDIVELASHFVQHYSKAFKKGIEFLPGEVIDLLLTHHWPGNVRELENVIQRSVLLARSDMITEKDLIFDEGPLQNNSLDYFGDIIRLLPESSLKDLTARFETDVITYALKKTQSNVVQAASFLNLGKTALYDKMKRHAINPKSIK